MHWNSNVFIIFRLIIRASEFLTCLVTKSCHWTVIVAYIWKGLGVHTDALAIGKEGIIKLVTWYDKSSFIQYRFYAPTIVTISSATSNRLHKLMLIFLWFRAIWLLFWCSVSRSSVCDVITKEKIPPLKWALPFLYHFDAKGYVFPFSQHNTYIAAV